MSRPRLLPIRGNRLPNRTLAVLFLAGLLLPLVAEAAEQERQATIDELKRSIDHLRNETARQIGFLQEELERLEGRVPAAGRQAEAAESPRESAPERLTSGAVVAAPKATFDGDFRVRYEHTSGQAGFPSRDRGVLRGRLGVSYTANERVTLGARLTTGDADDPNSTDVSMGQFVDDLAVSLDLAYATFSNHKYTLTAGKFRNPFDTTELLWDGDVNPLGVAGRIDLVDTGPVWSRLVAVYSVVDEQVVAADSNMTGIQFLAGYAPGDDWSVTASTAYYDYSIKSLQNADLGDTRDNNTTPDGTAYVSDFDLVDLVSSLRYTGISPKWPLSLTGHMVQNLGARVAEDTAYSIDLLAGRTAEPGDIRVRYGFAAAEKDAVLAAFSQDNTTFATNYRQHTLAVDYVPITDIVLNLTAYYYKRADPSLEILQDGDDYVSRLRLNVSFAF